MVDGRLGVTGFLPYHRAKSPHTAVGAFTPEYIDVMIPRARFAVVLANELPSAVRASQRKVSTDPGQLQNSISPHCNCRWNPDGIVPLAIVATCPSLDNMFPFDKPRCWNHCIPIAYTQHGSGAVPFRDVRPLFSVNRRCISNVLRIDDENYAGYRGLRSHVSNPPTCIDDATGLELGLVLRATRI